jgi:hypothetical protein
MPTIRRLAPWLLLGPITGPLAEGVYRNFRRGEPVLAWLYALALSIAWYDLSRFGGELVRALGSVVP